MCGEEQLHINHFQKVENYYLSLLELSCEYIAQNFAYSLTEFGRICLQNQRGFFFFFQEIAA